MQKVSWRSSDPIIQKKKLKDYLETKDNVTHTLFFFFHYKYYRILTSEVYFLIILFYHQVQDIN